MIQNRLSELLALLFVAMPFAAEADQYGDFTYSTDGTNVTITGYTGSGGAVIIPNWVPVNGVNLPVTSIGNSAFLGCLLLTTITIPSSVTSIEGEMFSDCYRLTNVSIGTNVASIGAYAFYYCQDLTDVTIPDGVASIGPNTFNGCTNLAAAAIGRGVTNIGDDVFYGCPRLSAISVDTSNPAYSSVNGVLFDKRQATLIQYPIGNAATSYTIPGSVSSVGSVAFYHCQSLTNVTIGSGLTSVVSRK